jgi:hypothetical protein
MVHRLFAFCGVKRCQGQNVKKRAQHARTARPARTRTVFNINRILSQHQPQRRHRRRRSHWIDLPLSYYLEVRKQLNRLSSEFFYWGVNKRQNSKMKVPTAEGGYPYLELLPIELVRYVLSFADIPSLGALIQTGQNASAIEASSDYVWADLVRRRFRMETQRTAPKYHGGRSWKHAYRSMARCNRLFKSRYTSNRKVVFAKNDQRANPSEDPAVSLWVTVGHTENCETRFVRGDDNRFVELFLCLQNVSSSSGTVKVNVMDAALRLVGNNADNGVRLVQKEAPWRPKLRLSDESKTDKTSVEACDIRKGITLAPFQVAVVSVHFPCAGDMFETDILAKAVALDLPVRRLMKESGNGELSNVSALFLPESAIWNYYTELPGGCLTLTDRYRLVAT